VARLRWTVYEHAAPTLLNRDNYGRPLAYIIAPCGIVTDVREALLADRKVDNKAAILIEDRQNEGRPQPIQWRTAGGRISSIVADPASGALRLCGGPVAMDVAGVVETAGLSATPTPARNLRGIDVPAPASATRIEVSFPTPEPDAAYSLNVQPSWLTHDAVTTKTPAGFTVVFSAAAPAEARLDWQLIR